MKKILIGQFWEEDKIKDYLSSSYAYTEEGKYSTSTPNCKLFSNLFWEDSFEIDNTPTNVFFFSYNSQKIKAIVILESFVDGKRVVFIEGYATVHLAFKKYGTKFLMKSGYKTLKQFLAQLSVQINHAHISAVVDRAYENSEKEREANGDFSADIVEDDFKL